MIRVSVFFVFLCVAIQLSQHRLLKCLGIFVKIRLTMNVKVYFGTFSSVPWICVPVLMPGPPCLLYLFTCLDDFTVIVELGSVSPPTVLFFFRIVLAVLGPLHYTNIHLGSACEFLPQSLL